jgi:acetoin utilization deacetylase AcuC-like enzyme
VSGDHGPRMLPLPRAEVRGDGGPGRRTGFLWHEAFMWFAAGAAGPPGSDSLAIEPGDFGEESPHARRRLHNLLAVSGILDVVEHLPVRLASDEELERVHTPAYLDALRRGSRERGGVAGEVTTYGPGGFEIAALAAGACLAAVDGVLEGRVDNAYALVRPAGHHALPDRGRGFCVLANAALAVRHAQRAHGLRRVAIVDWDVHHGNGAQEVFWDDPDVLTISMHQADWYPRGEGAAEALGGPGAAGRTVNVPLPPGSGMPAYAAAMERIVLPALEAHRPELIVVSCGLDANAMDPSGRMLLAAEDFRGLSRYVREAAGALCGGRLVLCHEGGYSATYVPFCGLAVLEELCGRRTPIADPFAARYRGVGYEELQAHQAEAIDHVAALLAAVAVR